MLLLQHGLGQHVKAYFYYHYYYYYIVLSCNVMYFLYNNQQYFQFTVRINICLGNMPTSKIFSCLCHFNRAFVLIIVFHFTLRIVGIIFVVLIDIEYSRSTSPDMT